jgi:hypothetical protein
MSASGSSDYVEVLAGTLPIVISVPHGGNLKPANLPDRPPGPTVCVEPDWQTVELARCMAHAFSRQVGRAPTFVISHLHRIKMDANRNLDESAVGHADTTAAWQTFHAAIDHAKADAIATYGAALYLDLHGQSHDANRTQVGYLIRGVALEELDDEKLDGSEHATLNSLRSLVDGTVGGRPAQGVAGLVRGPTSLGAMFQDAGYGAVPSPVHPHPRGIVYYNGGYNTRRHGSLEGGLCIGMQLETQFHGIRHDEVAHVAFAQAFVGIIQRYMSVHFPAPCQF